MLRFLSRRAASRFLSSSSIESRRSLIEPRHSKTLSSCVPAVPGLMGSSIPLTSGISASFQLMLQSHNCDKTFPCLNSRAFGTSDKILQIFTIGDLQRPAAKCSLDRPAKRNASIYPDDRQISLAIEYVLDRG